MKKAFLLLALSGFLLTACNDKEIDSKEQGKAQQDLETPKDTTKPEQPVEK